VTCLHNKNFITPFRFEFQDASHSPLNSFDPLIILEIDTNEYIRGRFPSSCFLTSSLPCETFLLALTSPLENYRAIVEILSWSQYRTPTHYLSRSPPPPPTTTNHYLLPPTFNSKHELHSLPLLLHFPPRKDLQLSATTQSQTALTQQPDHQQHHQAHVPQSLPGVCEIASTAFSTQTAVAGAGREGEEGE